MNLKGQSIAEYRLYEGPYLVANETIKDINKKKAQDSSEDELENLNLTI